MRAGMAARNREATTRKYQATLRALARRVVALRSERELTQDEAAHRAGIDTRTWQRLEYGEVMQPTLLSLVGVAQALDVEVWELLRASPRRA